MMTFLLWYSLALISVGVLANLLGSEPPGLRLIIFIAQSPILLFLIMTAFKLG